MRASTRLRSLLVLLYLDLLLMGTATSQVNVATYHNDNSRTGQNIAEIGLTPANVNVYTFGRFFSVQLDGQVYAQPLVLGKVTISGKSHQVVYVATENDSVYAIDGYNGTIYWKKSFINPPTVEAAPSNSSEINCGDISPQYGITSTPVIDPTTGTLYVVPLTLENGAIVHRLHALDVTSGAEKFGGPVQISVASDFDPHQQMNRPGLLLENGHVIIAWGSHCDHVLDFGSLSPYYGWIMSYNASTLAQEATYNDDADNPSGTGENAAIWMSGGGVAADASGNLYFATGNGDYGPNTTTPVDFGCSILKLSPPSGGKFTVIDWFTPHNQSSCNDPNDLDVGSGGVVLLPTLSSGKQLLAQMGKPGTIYEVEIDNNKMGHYCNGCSYDSNIFGEIQSASPNGVWGTPAYWNGFLYWGGKSDNLKAFSFNTTTGVISTSPVAKSSQVFSFPGTSASISANGTTNGIVWVLDNSSYGSSCCQVLHAYNATTLAELYNTTMDSSRDQFGGAVKFTVPTIANGMVYVAGAGNVVSPGLLSVFGGMQPQCIPTTSCTLGGQPPNQSVAGGVTLQCGQAMLLSASATICGGGTCKTNTVAPPVPTTSVGAGDGVEPASGGTCSLSWSWPYGSGSQNLSVP